MTIVVHKCPICGAPARPSAAECSYCRSPFASPPADPPSAEQRRAIRPGLARGLERALDEGGGRQMWERGRAAWAREAEVGRAALEASTKAESAALSGMLAAAYGAALEGPEISETAYDARVASLWALVDGALPRSVLDLAIDRWDGSLRDEGIEGFTRRILASLPSAEQRRAAFELAAAVAATSGITSSDEEVFWEVAQIFGISEAEAEAVATRVSRE